MNRVAVAYLTKDRVELSKRTIEPLIQPGKFDVFWCDGSTSDEARRFMGDQFEFRMLDGFVYPHRGVRGGADAAIVYALTAMFFHGNAGRNNGSLDQPYDYVGLVENDVLLPPDWFEQTMHLFEQGRSEGLNVGAVSPRCYEDRVLIQRDGYAVCHNLGAGVVIFTREAARIVLDHYRSAWSTDNRHIFCQLSGLDIGRWWAFRGNPQWLTADWGFDAALARSGLSSLSLTPSYVEMVGQTPPLADQGLVIAAQPVEPLRNDDAFALYQKRLACLWEGQARMQVSEPIHRDVLGNYTIFPHQIHMLGGLYTSPTERGWRLKWTQGFGPFSWQCGFAPAEAVIPLSGHCEILVSGGESGSQVQVTDDHSGFTCEPVLAPEGSNTQIMAIAVPAGVSYREIRLTVLSPGAVFYGIQTREPQMLFHGTRFDHSVLPPSEGTSNVQVG